MRGPAPAFAEAAADPEPNMVQDRRRLSITGYKAPQVEGLTKGLFQNYNNWDMDQKFSSGSDNLRHQ